MLKAQIVTACLKHSWRLSIRPHEHLTQDSLSNVTYFVSRDSSAKSLPPPPSQEKATHVLSHLGWACLTRRAAVSLGASAARGTGLGSIPSRLQLGLIHGPTLPEAPRILQPEQQHLQQRRQQQEQQEQQDLQEQRQQQKQQRQSA